MALDTFSNLKTSIANWIHRDDLTSQIPDFITLCEAKINRVLRIAQVEVRATATLDGQYEGLPTDFLEMRSIQTTGATGHELEYVTPQKYNQEYKTSDSGNPVIYTIIGSEIAFGPPPQDSYTMEMVYYKGFTALSDSNTTNWVLTNHPDVYLYGSLLAAEAHIKNDPRIEPWRRQYDEAIMGIVEADSRARYPGPLRIRRG